MMAEMNQLLSGMKFNNVEFGAKKFRLSEGDGAPMTGRFKGADGDLSSGAQGFRGSANVFHNYPSPLIANVARQSAVGGASMMSLGLNDQS